MKRSSRAGHGTPNARSRGVSPIIAEILLVASTVVCAGILYVVVSGYISGGASHPTDNIGMGQSLPSLESCGGTPTYHEVLDISSVSGSLTTDEFGLKVLSTVNSTTLVTTAPARQDNGCPSTGVDSGWWALLEYPAGTVNACFGSNNSGLWTSATSGSCTNASPTPGISLNEGDQFVVYVVGTNPGGAYSLSAYGVGGATVTGTTDL